MGKFVDLTGLRFCRLKVVSRKGTDKYGAVIWNCLCDCGNTIVTRGASLKSGETRSCKCLQRESARNIGYKNKKYNTYNLSGEYGIGYTSTGKEFYFDLEDYDKIKDYCWGVSSQEYVITNSYNEKAKGMHSLVMDCPEGMDVDHIYHNTRDNRKQFLRVCTRAENCRNKGVCNGVSGHIGVYYTRKKYKAYITLNRETIVLGYFDNIEDAVFCRKKAEELYFGEYAPKYS